MTEPTDTKSHHKAQDTAKQPDATQRKQHFIEIDNRLNALHAAWQIPPKDYKAMMGQLEEAKCSQELTTMSKLRAWVVDCKAKGILELKHDPDSKTLFQTHYKVLIANYTVRSSEPTNVPRLTDLWQKLRSAIWRSNYSYAMPNSRMRAQVIDIPFIRKRYNNLSENINLLFDHVNKPGYLRHTYNLDKSMDSIIPNFSAIAADAMAILEIARAAINDNDKALASLAELETAFFNKCWFVAQSDCSTKNQNLETLQNNINSITTIHATESLRQKALNLLNYYKGYKFNDPEHPSQIVNIITYYNQVKEQLSENVTTKNAAAISELAKEGIKQASLAVANSLEAKLASAKADPALRNHLQYIINDTFKQNPNSATTLKKMLNTEKRLTDLIEKVARVYEEKKPLVRSRSKGLMLSNIVPRLFGLGVGGAGFLVWLGMLAASVLVPLLLPLFTGAGTIAFANIVAGGAFGLLPFFLSLLTAAGISATAVPPLLFVIGGFVGAATVATFILLAFLLITVIVTEVTKKGIDKGIKQHYTDGIGKARLNDDSTHTTLKDALKQEPDLYMQQLRGSFEPKPDKRAEVLGSRPLWLTSDQIDNVLKSHNGSPVAPIAAGRN